MIANGSHDVPAGKIVMAITRLEMKTKPPLPDVALPQGMTFEAVKFDPPHYRDLFTRVGQEWLWYSRLNKSDRELAAHFSDPKVQMFTLRKDGQDEAMLELDFRVAEECELAYFGLTAPLIGCGAGRFLMTQAITLAWEQPIKRFHLKTCNYDSPQALGFYLRSGFVPYGRQIEIDDDPRLTGVVPTTAAPHVPIIAG